MLFKSYKQPSCKNVYTPCINHVRSFLLGEESKEVKKKTEPEPDTRKLRRVVVTGIGVVSPIGCNVNKAWETILTGVSHVTKLGSEYDHLPCKVAALIDEKELDLKVRIPENKLRTMSKATAYAMIAAEEAIKDSKFIAQDSHSKHMTGVSVGMGMIDFNDIFNTQEALKNSYNKVSPYFIPRILPNMAAGQLSIEYGCMGPNNSNSGACATGLHAIGDAFRLIRHNYADVMICGSTEAPINPLSMAGFCRLRAVSTDFNETPELASRPFDRDRDGFVMGEGAGILVLEEVEHAMKRKAFIYAEIRGYGSSGDAAHLTAPREDGGGQILSMSNAIKDANIKNSYVSYVNAHASSTQLGDAIEAKAIKTLFGEHSWELAISSTKGAHGHLLGAAGSLETILTIKAIQTGILPPTVNAFNVPDDENMNYIPLFRKEWYSHRRISMKNSFGFGGTNATLILSAFREKVG